MSALSIDVFTLQIPNPEWQHDRASNGLVHRLNDSISFHCLISSNIGTLSTTGANSANDVTGLIYVPTLNASSPCVNASAPYLPQTVARRANLPSTDYDLVAIAPWISPECTLGYLDAVGNDPVRGFLFFQPGNSSAVPPDASDPAWDLDDGGRWKQKYGFPVYVVSGLNGTLLVQALGQYSGNVTDVPHGEDLVKIYDTRDYIRLFVDIDTGSGGTTLPSLWVFLLVVLGILLAIIALTSLSMHWLQRRRRTALRRRVASGEVDLEALGIKRLTVPQELLDRMPLYVYGTGQPVTQASLNDVSDSEEKSSALVRSLSLQQTVPPTTAFLRSSSYRPTALSQPTCAICLDDFVAATAGAEGTTVRELPCQHIFHPECVDTFLRDNSSLCPMCKKTALPRGYCPKVITNAMVRRERMVRQIRERVTVESDVGEISRPESRISPNFATRFRIGPRSAFSQSRNARGFGHRPMWSSQQLERLDSESTTTNNTAPSRLRPATSDGINARHQVQPPSTPGRREWARQRAVTMLGHRPAPADTDAEEARATSTWLKAVRDLFPGLHR